MRPLVSTFTDLPPFLCVPAVWFGITTIMLIGAARSSITLILLLFVLDLTFAMLGAFYYTGNAKFETAGE